MRLLKRLFGRKRSEATKPACTPYPATRPFAGVTAGRRRMLPPDPIVRFYVPLSVLEATSHAMRRYGAEGRECYVWWGGYFTSAGEAQVVTALCPEVATEYGHIHLSNAQLTELQNQLRSLDQALLVELHTHPPGGNGQNSVDAAHPAATYGGFISIVVPEFAFPNFYDLRQAYIYKYLGEGRWHEMSSAEVEREFVVEEGFLSVRV